MAVRLVFPVATRLAVGWDSTITGKLEGHIGLPRSAGVDIILVSFIYINQQRSEKHDEDLVGRVCKNPEAGKSEEVFIDE
jgi:hypothetical protein